MLKQTNKTTVTVKYSIFKGTEYGSRFKTTIEPNTDYNMPII